jgi:type IV pilus modification protein PilV
MRINNDNQIPDSAHARAGFTLIEVLIAMLILAIGMMAALSMQFTALGGAVAARDTANATDVAQRMLHMMRVESQQWRDQDISQSNMTDPVFADFTDSSLLTTVDDSSWEWQPVFSSPVDARLTEGGNARYCAYVRGGYLNRDDAGLTDNSVLQVQVAVLYPAGGQIFGDDCPGDGSTLVDIANMEPGVDPTDDDSIERAGFRAIYLGSTLTRRGWLS